MYYVIYTAIGSCICPDFESLEISVQILSEMNFSIEVIVLVIEE